MGDGQGRVVSSPAGIDCPGTCEARFEVGAEVTLTTTPTDGATVSGYSNHCAGDTCAVSVGSDLEVAVTLSADPCEGIFAPAEVAMQSHVVPFQRMEMFSCGGGSGDGTGVLAFPIEYAHMTGLDVVAAQGGQLHSAASDMSSTVYPQPSGFFTLGSPYLGPYRIALEAWAPDGTEANARGYFNGNHCAVVENPLGGVLLAGDVTTEAYEDAAPSLSRQMTMFAQTPSEDGALRAAWGPVALPGTGTIFGAGVDAKGRTLIISDGTQAFGPNTIAGQWFDADGSVLSTPFALIRGFDPALATWFEASPLIGSGLLVQGVVPFLDGTPRVYRHNLLVIDDGGTSPRPPPDWLARRVDTRLQRLPSGKGYAVLPDGANGVPCTQHLEVVARDGTSCGERAFQISDGTCDTLDLTLGLDGTVIQQLPTEKETWATFDGQRTGDHSCTWRWWTRAVH